MNQIEKAEKEIEAVEDKLVELNHKINKYRRQRASINEQIDKAIDDEKLDEVTELKIQKESITDIIKNLNDKKTNIKKYELENAEQNLKRVKGQAAHLKNQIRQKLIDNKFRKDEIEELQREINKTKKIIKRNKNKIDDFKKSYENIYGEKPVFEDEKIQKQFVRAKNERMTGVVVDKKLE